VDNCLCCAEENVCGILCSNNSHFACVTCFIMGVRKCCEDNIGQECETSIRCIFNPCDSKGFDRDHVISVFKAAVDMQVPDSTVILKMYFRWLKRDPIVSMLHPTNGRLLHFNVTCLSCNISPLKGPRFKCSTCANFDLCSDCMRRLDFAPGKVHSPDHVFLCIVNPVAADGPPAFADLTDNIGRVGGFECGKCGIKPIRGHAFDCGQCSTRICSRCEQNDPCPHPVMKILLSRVSEVVADTDTRPPRVTSTSQDDRKEQASL
jgi:hypothetical protein